MCNTPTASKGLDRGGGGALPNDEVSRICVNPLPTQHVLKEDLTHEFELPANNSVVDHLCRRIPAAKPLDSLQTALQ